MCVCVSVCVCVRVYVCGRARARARVSAHVSRYPVCHVIVCLYARFCVVVRARRGEEGGEGVTGLVYCVGVGSEDRSLGGRRGEDLIALARRGGWPPTQKSRSKVMCTYVGMTLLSATKKGVACGRHRRRGALSM